MNHEHNFISDLTEAYERSPRDTMVALWAEFRGKNQRGNIVEFAAYITTNYPEIAEKISTTAEKEFVGGWKNTGEARKLHSEVSRIRENGIYRREFIGRSVVTAVSSCLYFSPLTGPSFTQRKLAALMAYFVSTQKVSLVHHQDDPSSLLWKTTLLPRMNADLMEGFGHLFLDQVNEKEQSMVLGNDPLKDETDDKITDDKIRAWRQYHSAHQYFVDNTDLYGNNIVARKLGEYFDAYSIDHAAIAGKLPADIIHEIRGVWYSIYHNHTKYDWIEIIQKSAERALQYRADEETELTEEQLKSIDEMEGHYHGRAILEEWKRKANTETTSDYKKYVKKERKRALQTLKKEWGMAVGSVIGELTKLEEKFFPKKGKIIIP